MKRKTVSHYLLPLAFLLCIRIFVGKAQEDCGGVLTATWGYIMSPGYPVNGQEDARYPPSVDCTWTVPGESDTLQRLRFFDLSIEPGENNSNITCDYDYLNVSLPSIGWTKYCGSFRPHMVSGLGELTLHFHSDESVNYRGFRLGYQKQDKYNPCAALPCKQNGDCSASQDGINYICSCHAGWTGPTCEIDIAECDSNPCQNGAICSEAEGPNMYKCQCAVQWEGVNCETRRSPPCDPSPCKHGATCIPVGDFERECECAPGYLGELCDEETGCGNPGIPYLNKDRRFDFDTVLQFSCKEGYIIIGLTVSKCHLNGSWSVAMPGCRENGTSTEKETGVSPWAKAMIGLGTLFTVNVVVMVSYLVYKSPVSVLEKLRSLTSTEFNLQKTTTPAQIRKEVSCVSATQSEDVVSFGSSYLS